MVRALRTLAASAMMIMLLGVPSRGFAADQSIAGKKLLIKADEVVLLSKDAGIGVAGSNPVGGADSSVTFDDGSSPVTFALPANLWSTKGAGKPFKYNNTAAPSGPSPVKIVILKAGLLKVVAKGGPFVVPSGAATINVVLNLDGTTNKYCMTFSGTGDGNKFLVKDATAGTCSGGGSPTPTPPAIGSPTSTATPSGPGCGNGVREGIEECDGSDATSCPGKCLANCTCCDYGSFVAGGCWGVDMSVSSRNCDDVCADQGRFCDAAALGLAGSAGTKATCEAVTEAVENAASGSIAGGAQSCAAGSGCYVFGVGAPPTFSYTRCTSPATTCAAPGPAGCNIPGNFNCGRVCACLTAVCGNNAKEGPEECDGTDDAACPGLCKSDCMCAVCGNDIKEGAEQCDGADDAACPGHCLADCTCAAQFCGNNIKDGTEQCDGSDATACPGRCLANCTCCSAAGTVVGGGCWFVDESATAQSCDNVCAAHALSCDAATLNFAGSAGTNANCEAVSEAVEGKTPGSIGGSAASCSAGSGCYVTAVLGPSFSYTRCTSPATTCAAPGPSGCNTGVSNCGRLCACH